VTKPSEHDTPARSMETGIWQILIFTRGGTLGPPPLFMSIQQSLHFPPVPGDRNKWTDLRPRQARGSPKSDPQIKPRRCNDAAAKAGRATASDHLHVLLYPSLPFSTLLCTSQSCDAARVVVALEQTSLPHLHGRRCPAAWPPPRCLHAIIRATTQWR
jgi:hypothetical protein